MTHNKNGLETDTTNDMDEELFLAKEKSQMAETTTSSSSIPNKSLSFIQRYFPCGFRDEALTLTKITVPFAMGNVLSSWLISFISLALVGHAHGQLELNACALALSTYVLIGNSLMLGLNFGCDTLLPQCLGGNKRKMGLTIQRAILITGYSCLISWTLLLNAKFVLKHVEHDQEVVRLADTVSRSFILVVPFDGLSLLLQKYIASNEKTWPILIFNIISNIVNAFLTYIFLYKFHFGIRSVPIAIAISYIVIVLCAILYIRFSSIYQETWHPINRACLDEWNVYLRLSAPGVLMIMTEFWSLELSIFFAASLGARSLSAQICAYQSSWLFYLITASFATAANIRIGQFLGAGKPLEAANTKNVTYALGALVILFNMSLLLIVHYWFPLVYKTEKDALTLARRVLLLIVIFQLWDGSNIINTGIVKACGRQKRGALIAFCGFYLFGIPLAGILMFWVRIDIYGFWLGIILAETVTNTLLFLLIHRFNWEKHAKTALIRVKFNTNNGTTDIATVPNPDEKSEKIQIKDTNQISWIKLLRIKIIVLFLFICILITGIITSIVIPF